MKFWEEYGIYLYVVLGICIILIGLLNIYNVHNKPNTNNTHNKKIDSLQNVIFDYDRQLYEEKTKRIRLYEQNDSLERIIDNNIVNLPDLQKLKRTK